MSEPLVLRAHGADLLQRDIGHRGTDNGKKIPYGVVILDGPRRVIVVTDCSPVSLADPVLSAQREHSLIHRPLLFARNLMISASWVGSDPHVCGPRTTAWASGRDRARGARSWTAYPSHPPRAAAPAVVTHDVF